MPHDELGDVSIPPWYAEYLQRLVKDIDKHPGKTRGEWDRLRTQDPARYKRIMKDAAKRRRNHIKEIVVMFPESKSWWDDFKR